MLTLHHPNIKPIKWDVEYEQEQYNIVVQFPIKTPFDADQLTLVQQVNECRVIRVWVQPETDRVLLCASVRPSRFGEQITITEIHIIHRRISNPSKKRRHTEET